MYYYCEGKGNIITVSNRELYWRWQRDGRAYGRRISVLDYRTSFSSYKSATRLEIKIKKPNSLCRRFIQFSFRFIFRYLFLYSIFRTEITVRWCSEGKLFRLILYLKSVQFPNIVKFFLGLLTKSCYSPNFFVGLWQDFFRR